jgi:hypothetical protein
VISLIWALVASAPNAAWAEFSRADTLSQVNETVEVRSVPERAEYQLTYTRQSGRKTQTFTTTSTTCPYARPVINSMRGLSMPHLAPFGVDGDRRGRFQDGAMYTLSGPTDSPDGQITVSSNTGAPLAAWVDKALGALELCWRQGRQRSG